MTLNPTQTMIALGPELKKLGFFRTYTSRTGSRYFRLNRIPFHLRISDHQWSYISSQKQVQVVHNVVTTELSEEQVHDLALDIAIAFMFKVRDRTGDVRGL